MRAGPIASRAARLCLLFGLLALSLTAQAPQEPTAELLEALEEPDRDERRELALRTLSAWPESPAAALRAWARGGGFRRQVALLRVLGERQELRVAELRAGLSARPWIVRFEAARAAGNCFDIEGLGDDLRALLTDPFPAVRREALRALDRRGEILERELLAMLAVPSLQRTAAKAWLATPAQYSTQVLPALLEHEAAREVVLERGVGAIPAASHAALADFVRSAAPAASRAAALLCLPTELWPEMPERLVLAACRESSTALRLGPLLPVAAKQRLLVGLFDCDEEELFVRLALAYPLPPGLVAPLLREHARCPTESLGVLLRFARRCDEQVLVDEALHSFGSLEDEGRIGTWLGELAPVLREHAELVPLFERALTMDAALAALAYRACIAAHVGRDAVLAWARAERERIVQFGRLLLLLPEPAPAEFFLSLRADPDPKLRSLAASGLRKHIERDDVRAAVREGFAREDSEVVRSAWLYALFAFAGADEIARVVAELVESDDRLVRLSLRKFFETSERDFVDPFLRERRIPGWEREALLLRGTRGDLEAGRRLWEMLPELDESELLRARKAVTLALRDDDREVFARRLLGEGEARALPHVRNELITLLRRRPDLPWGDLLRRALAEEQDQIVREQLAAALAERDDFAGLQDHVDHWVESQGLDEEGLLLEVIGALQGEPAPAELRFLVQVLVAPIARDPLAGVREELRRLQGPARVDAQFPMLRPVVLGLARARPEAVAAALRAEFLRPERRLAWARASKGYLVLALAERHGAEVSLSALAPLVDWARRLGPRPHPADGELLLLEAELQRQEGNFALAAQAWRAGLRHLIRQDLAAREIERISRDLVAADADFGWSTLHAHGAWLEAVAAHLAGQAREARICLARARLAARGDAELMRRIDETEQRIEERDASRPPQRRR